MGAVERFCHRAMLLERGRGRRDRRARARSAAATSSSTSAATSAPAATRRRRPETALGDGRARDRRGVVRGRARASAPTSLAQGQRVRVPRARALPRARRGPDLRRQRSRTSEPADVFATLDAVDQERTGSFAGRRRGRCSRVALRRTCFAPGRYFVTPVVAHARRRRTVIDRRERLRARRRRPARAQPGGIVDLPARDRARARRGEPRGRVSAASDGRPTRAGRADRPGPSALGGDPRRFVAPHLDARRHRVQAALLRLGARLPVAADAAADAVRRALRRLHASSCKLGDGVTFYPVVAAARASCCSRSSPRRRAAPSRRSSTARAWCARSTSRASAIPLSVVLTRVVQPRAEPLVVLVFVLVIGRAGRAGPGSRCRCCSRPASCSRSGSRCCSRRSTCAIRDMRPIWEVVAPDPVLRDAGALHRRDIPETAELASTC